VTRKNYLRFTWTPSWRDREEKPWAEQRDLVLRKETGVFFCRKEVGDQAAAVSPVRDTVNWCGTEKK